jgi:hypothetical protein
MRVNAGLKSKRELIERMMKGEKFFLDDTIIYFDEKRQCSPFVAYRAGHYPEEHPLHAIFDCFEKMQTERPHHWTDDLDKGPILCEVWDSLLEKKFFRAVVEVSEDGKYKTQHIGDYYDEAKPVAPDHPMIYKPHEEK